MSERQYNIKHGIKSMLFFFYAFILHHTIIITERKNNADSCSLPRKTQKTDKQNTKKSAREKTSWRI